MNHVILKQNIEVTMHGNENSFTFSRKLSDVCRYELNSGIEKLFDKMIPRDTIIRIDKLEIDAGILPKQNWEKEYVKRVMEKLSRYLDSLQHQKFEHSMTHEITAYASDDILAAGVSEIKKEENIFGSLLYFLEHGTLPWYSVIRNFEELKKSLKLIEGRDFLLKLTQFLKKTSVAVERLLNQFDSDSLDFLILKLCPEQIDREFTKAWKIIMQNSGIRDEIQKHIIYQSVFETIFDSDEKTFKEIFSEKVLLKIKYEEKLNLKHLIKHIKLHEKELNLKDVNKFKKQVENLLGENLIESKELTMLTPEDKKDIAETEKISIKKEDVKIKEPEFPEEEKVWYVKNSGLVLIHGFLPVFFRNTGYLEKNEWLNEEVKQRAVALTQFMMTGLEEYPEFGLLLNKILCGYEIEKTLPFDIKLSDFEKDEATDLLFQIIKHWKALKNTSIEGMRNTFFLRDGRITYTSNGWLLQVERKTVDILLNKLPWGFSMIKLPWMKEMLTVEWE